jgi:GTP pyrophosphokinase
MTFQTPENLAQQLFCNAQTLNGEACRPCQVEACKMALEADNLPQRSSVRSYEVAQLLAELHMDERTLIATLLSDANLEPIYPLTKISQQFDEATAQLTQGIRRLNEFKHFDRQTIDNEVQSERLRQMLLAMTSDIRIMIVKLAYRVIRLRHLKYEDEETRQQVAYETQLVFAPLANRLGIAQLKWELEDLSFRFLHPKDYKEIAKQLQAKRTQREAYIDNMITELQKMMQTHHIPSKITGRPKHIYSIWKKMQRKKLPLDELYDLRAVRIYVDDVKTCYEVLGIIHSRWNYIKEEFDDYIASPKENGYQSIHTVIIGPKGKTVEIQIRTYEMHAHAEFGVAAHWKYKEGKQHFDENLEKSIANVRQLLENIDDPEVFNEISTELESKNIYVLTPNEEIITLRQGATPLDFAYHIHTELGHRSRGAKVNGRIVPLTTPLQTGDRVEILTTKEGKPNRNWLNPNLGYLKTASARNKVRQWFNKFNRSANIEAGRELLKKELKRQHAQHLKFAYFVERFRLENEEQLFDFIGKGQINERQINDAIQRAIRQERQLDFKEFESARTQPGTAYVIGAPQLKTQLAPCCEPAEGDDIVGYVTRGRGITVHKKSCLNILNLTDEEKKRLIEVAWASGNENQEASPRKQKGKLEIKLLDLPGRVSAILQTLTQAQVEVEDMIKRPTDTEGEIQLNLHLMVPENFNPSALLDRLEALPSVLEAFWRAE